MSGESTVRGSGKPLAGASGVTMAIWHALTMSGGEGLLFPDLLERVEPEVPIGLAVRRFRKRLPDVSKLEQGDGAPAYLHKRAIRFLVRDTLSSMVKLGTAIKRSDGTYVASRRPKSAGVVNGFNDDLDGSATRRHVQIMEALRILRPARTRRLKRTMSSYGGTRTAEWESRPAFNKREWEAFDALFDALDNTSRDVTPAS